MSDRLWGVVTDPHCVAGSAARKTCTMMVPVWRKVAGGVLEVRTRAGDWLSARDVPGAFVCNIGDCLMRRTNDI